MRARPRAPACRVAYKALLLEAGLARPEGLLREQTFIRDFPGKILYVGSVRGQELDDILIYHLGTETEPASYFQAQAGHVSIDPAARQITLTLTNVYHFQRDSAPIPIQESQLPPLQLGASTEGKPKLSDMTLSQLQAELRDLEARVRHTDAIATSTNMTESLKSAMHAAAGQPENLTLPARVQLHRRFAFSLAPLGFTLIGIPLGIRAHRRETSVGIAMALLLVALYFAFLILGQSLETKPAFHPHFILWAPNFLFQGIGAWLLWRATYRV